MTNASLRTACLLAALFACAPHAFAQKKQEGTITDPAAAGPDYAVQGEYAGKLNRGGEQDAAYGAQVIALGGGKFRLVLYSGGLPGAGWARGDKRESVEGAREGDVTSFTAKGWGAVIEDQVLTVTDSGGTVQGTLAKTVRKSPTLGAKPPEGAIVLFDGSTAEHFKDGHLTDDHLLLAGCESLQKFGDHSFHVEFRTPFKPAARGQARGNSGVYLQSRYEMQVLDSFGLDGKNNECGGIYSISEPAVNMCFPPLTWQTYDVQFTAARYDENGKKTSNARATVRHNGVVIHDDLELTKGTPGKLPEGPEPQGLYLQGHGNPVVFRNIWVVTK